LTKPLPQPKHEAHMRAMGIRYISRLAQVQVEECKKYVL
jgi:hypothetical protein